MRRWFLSGRLPTLVYCFAPLLRHPEMKGCSSARVTFRCCSETRMSSLAASVPDQYSTRTLRREDLTNGAALCLQTCALLPFPPPRPSRCTPCSSLYAASTHGERNHVATLTQVIWSCLAS